MREVKNYKVVKNIAIVTLVLLCITSICLLTNLFSFYKYFLLGTFGLMIYPIVLLGSIYCILVVCNRLVRFNPKSLLMCLATLLFFICILHTAIASGFATTSYGEYLSSCYHSQASVGGVIIGVLVYPVQTLLFTAGAYVVFSICLLLSIAMIIDNYYDKSAKKKPNAQIERISFSHEKPKPEVEDVPTKTEKDRLLAKEMLGLVDNKSQNEEDVLDATTYLYGKGISKKEAFDTLYPGQDKEINSQNPNYLTYSLEKYIEGGQPRKPSKIIHNDNDKIVKPEERKNFNRKDKEFIDATKPTYINPHGIIGGDSYDRNAVDFVDEATKQEHNNILNQIKAEENYKSYIPEIPITPNSNTNVLPKIENIQTEEAPNFEQDTMTSDTGNIADEQDEVVFETPVLTKNVEVVTKDFQKPAYKVEENDQIEQVIPKPQQIYKPIRYFAPLLDFLTTRSEQNDELQEDAIKKTELLELALENFKVPAKVTDVVIGPAVTRYEIVMPPGISVKKILGYSDDIAMALEARGDVRIEAPIPGKNAVGIEVPNNSIATVGLHEVLGSKDFALQKSTLSFVLGKDISGAYRFCDLQKSPHLLIAGSTGSGKSVCLNTLIISLLYRATPEDLRLVLVDPKRVEFAVYNGLPHLLMPSVINDAEKALNAFNWAINEMEKRYITFEKNLVRDIGEYNQLPDIINKQSPKMPYIVMIVDELADLLSNNKKDFEEKIARLTAKARSAGIHLVLATQRPSVDVITGVIKNNLPSRIAFAVTSGADSKTILDQGGADKLLGKGDMLYLPLDMAEPVRIQGTFITNREIMEIVNYIKENNKCIYEENIEKKMTSKNFGVTNQLSGIVRGEDDELFPSALKLVIESGRPSKTFLQRCFRLGFSRAANLIDAMEQLHYITPAENGKKGEVFITIEEFKEKYGDI